MAPDDRPAMEKIDVKGRTIWHKPRPVFEGSAQQEPRGCRWIIGEISRPGWRYCQAKQAFGSSYCAEHRRMSIDPTKATR